MSKWPSQVSPSSSHQKDTLEQYRHAEQILTNRLAGQKAQEAHVIKTNEVHESCVCGQRYAFWYNLAPLVCLHLWFSFTKGKKKKQKNKQKTCLWLLLPTSEQTFKELPGTRTWHCASQVGTKFLVPNVRGEHAYDSAGNLWQSPLPCKGSSILPLQFHGTGDCTLSWHGTLPSSLSV